MYISITNNFYTLPKIHTSKQIKKNVQTENFEYIEIPNPINVKFRPIAAGLSRPSSRLSKLINILLHSFLNKIKSYIKDNIDFLNCITEKIDPNTLIATCDVTNLYSSIPHELGK